MSQAELPLLDDPYELFSKDLPEDYPKGKFKPLHPLFVKKGHVNTGTRYQRKYYVDLSIGECNCSKGYAFGYSDTKKSTPWYSASYCSHKLSMMASIVEQASPAEQELVERAYVAALSSRYNPFEVVSAFHKEIRRGDFEKAWFWGLVLAQKRKMAGVFKYLLNILYEETRDHDLGQFLLGCIKNPRMITLSNMSKAISWFCATPKKWQLPHRFAIFEAEMHGYRLLAKDYSADVAKGANIIPSNQRDRLFKFVLDGHKAGDMTKFQRGIKGLQKLKVDENGTIKDFEYIKLQEHRYWIYERLYELAETIWPDTHEGWIIVQYINDRMGAGQEIGYHELNAFADAIAGEPVSAGLLSPTAHKRAVARPAGRVILGKWPPIPLYAHDNHTWAGKAYMNRYPEQLLPGADQVDLDFRWCGAYFGVAYRMIKWRDHGESEVDWSAVKWPADLYSIVKMLWY